MTTIPNRPLTHAAHTTPAAEHAGSIWRLAWPQTLMMFFHFLIGFADVYVAGQIGDNVQAALGMITQILLFFLIIAIALANGSVSAVSQSLGAGKTVRAVRYINMVMGLVLVASLLLSVLAYPLRGLLLDLLRTPDSIRVLASEFLAIYLCLLPVYYLLVASNAVFRAQKKVHIPLLSMILVTGLNAFSDFGLCFGLFGLPRLGAIGLAWATLISVSCGCLFNCLLLLKRGWIQPSAFPPLRWMKSALPYLWMVAWPAGLMQTLWQTAYLVLFAITASLPRGEVVAMAALAAGIRIESILFLPAFAFNMTASILVGHALGQIDPPQAKRIGTMTWALGCLLVSAMGIGVWLMVDPVAGLLTTKTQVQQEIASYLHFNVAAIPFTATSMILGGVFLGAGATRYTMMAIGGTVWCVRLPLAFILGHLVLGRASGIWAAMFISQFIQSLLMAWIFFRRDWTRFSMQAMKHKNSQSSTHS
jgi:putative MATE family efflux protein